LQTSRSSPTLRAVSRKPVIDVAAVGRRGEIALSRRIRAALGVQEGDELLLSVEDGRLVAERRARRLATYLDVLAGPSSARDE
jgi:hypothetical protein